MPIATQNIIVASGRVSGLVTLPVELKQIETLSVIDYSNALQPNDTFVELGLMSGGTTEAHRVAALASGYIGRNNPVAWSGNIFTDADMFLYGMITSSTGGEFRLISVVFPLKITAEGAIALDP